mgnify:CR=1 FL=1
MNTQDGDYSADVEVEPCCEVCGSSMEWVDCDQCAGEGYSWHDCGEDVCCCLNPEDNVRCDQCDGNGGWWQCINRRAHEVSNA